MFKTIKGIFLSFVMLLPLCASAHGGHGAGAGHELFHYLASPAHFIPVAVTLALTVIALFFRNAWKTEKSRLKD